MIGLLRKIFSGPTPEAPEAGDHLQAGPIGGEISGRICELIGEYDPHHLTYARMKQMRNDADVAFGIDAHAALGPKKDNTLHLRP